MNELIDKLKAEANLTDEQAQKAIAAIAAFVKEKFPMLGGAVDNIFGGGNQDCSHKVRAVNKQRKSKEVVANLIL